MAYRQAAERIVWWPIKIIVVKDGGTVEEEEAVQIKFRLIDRDEVKKNITAAMEASAKTPLGKIVDKVRGPVDEEDAYLAKYVLDWKNVEDQDKNPIPFNAANLKACMQDMYFAKALNAGLAEASYGAARKN